MMKKFLCGLLAFALALGALWPSPWTGGGAEAVTQADIDALEGRLDDLARQIDQAEGRLARLQDDKAQALEQKALLDDQIALLDEQIAQLDQLVADYAAMVAEKQAEVDALQAREAAQYELFCRRVRAMEEQGTASYLSILFGSASFVELLDSAMLIGEIMDYDNDIILLLQATRQEAEEARAELALRQEEQQSALAEQQSARDRLEQRRAEAEQLVARILDQESDYQTALAQIEAEEERVQAEIVRLSRELDAQNRAARGGYIWPVSSHKVTSPFGPRNTGLAGASTNHKGIDIGNVGWNTQVCAAKAGTVIVSAKNSSYGNYVVVSHGNGNTTLYAHMSSRKVSAGQTVAQGDVLGITGDTGISYGPHLHFEITEDGARVDPLKYLTDYERCW